MGLLLGDPTKKIIDEKNICVKKYINNIIIFEYIFSIFSQYQCYFAIPEPCSQYNVMKLYVII